MFWVEWWHVWILTRNTLHSNVNIWMSELKIAAEAGWPISVNRQIWKRLWGLEGFCYCFNFCVKYTWTWYWNESGLPKHICWFHVLEASQPNSQLTKGMMFLPVQLSLLYTAKVPSILSLAHPTSTSSEHPDLVYSLVHAPLVTSAPCISGLSVNLLSTHIRPRPLPDFFLEGWGAGD